MYVEHIIFTSAIVLLLGVLFPSYAKTGILWLIVLGCILPDTDYILNLFMAPPYLSCEVLCHGDFHNFVAITMISLFVAYIFSHKYWYDEVFLFLFIGCSLHLLEDFITYHGSVGYQFHLFVPLSNLGSYGLGIFEPWSVDGYFFNSYCMIVGVLFLYGVILLKWYLEHRVPG